MAEASLPVFDAAAVQERLPMAACIDLMAEVQGAISRGEISLPLRSFVPLPDPANGLLVMPGGLKTPPVFGAKLLSLFPGNSTSNLPVIQGQVLLFDGTDGRPLALVEAAALTAIRTAAASAAATRLLANDETATLALLGYGVQAHSHLEAMRCVRGIEEVRVWGRDPDRAAAFAARYADTLDIRPAASPEAAVRGATVICAVTGATEPVIHSDWIQPGCHLNLVGAHSPAAREADGLTLARARVFTEISEFAMAESGEILLAIEEGFLEEADIAGEIGAVINGDLEGRQSPDQITLYKSLGNTAQDLAAAHAVLAAGQSSSG
jgi:ornithine cyclodeaminase